MPTNDWDTKLVSPRAFRFDPTLKASMLRGCHIPLRLLEQDSRKVSTPSSRPLRPLRFDGPLPLASLRQVPRPCVKAPSCPNPSASCGYRRLAPHLRSGLRLSLLFHPTGSAQDLVP